MRVVCGETLRLRPAGNLKNCLEEWRSWIPCKTSLPSELAFCPELTCLPVSALKYLSSLETFAIVECAKLDMQEWGSDGDMDLGKLRSFAVFGLPQLEVLLRSLLLQGANINATLKSLYIGCPNLSVLPEGIRCLTGFRFLQIKDCTELITRCRAETGESWPKIAHVSRILLDDLSMEQWSIEKDIDLVNLRSFVVGRLSQLEILPRWLLPRGADANITLRAEAGEDWSKIAHIPSIIPDRELQLP
ncbi:hypothetical protein RJ641_027169 [Dillenia turbinata]|uniref:Uncharacterized protein n=1 Tax=Dillenia turbinata TaxID=194707 RepID=A0AAN8ZLE5_9MAGN